MTRSRLLRFYKCTPRRRANRTDPGNRSLPRRADVAVLAPIRLRAVRLPTTLSIIPSSAEPFAGPTNVADGDSLAATAEFDESGCLDYSAVAGAAGASVVVTITESSPPTLRYCTMDKKTAIFRAVVRSAPRGAYDRC